MWVKWLVIVQLVYWGGFAAVSPVMNHDSQVYNLARLAVANVGGLFGNRGWNNVRQIVFPWTFDAVHYPFLFLHWGYCLPSFACFVGLLVIVHRLVTAGTGSARQGWWCCLALLAMPTMVYQAADTKNDVPVVFGAACWYYALRLWGAERRRAYLPLMALALGFTAGAKSTGLIIAGCLGIYTLFQLRVDRHAAVKFCAWMAISIVLFGSVETYVNNQLLYHSPLGPAAFIVQNKNRDGLAGATASFIRYCFGNMSVGVDAANPAAPTAVWLVARCREFLTFVGLGHDLGYRTGFGEVDANMLFGKSGGDAGSDYGPIGALALLGGFFFLLTRPPSDALWKLSAAAFGVIWLVCYTVAWMMWNARFLMLPFSLFAVALTLGIFRLGDNTFGRFTRSAFLLLAVFSSVIYIECAYSQNPPMLWRSIRHRPLAETFPRPGMLEIIQDLHRYADAKEPPILLVQAGEDSWLLSITEVRGIRVLPMSAISNQSLAACRSKAGYAPIYALTLNKPLAPAAGSNLTLLKRYMEAESALYQWKPPSGDSR